MIEPRHQFRVLYRTFLKRVVDLESLPDPGAVQKLAIQFTAMLAGFSFVTALLEVRRYSLSTLSPPQLLVAAWGSEEFLIATTMAVAGLLAVLAWDAVWPLRLDALVLGPLPVRVGTLGLAKGAAVASALAFGIVALNCFTGLCFPFLVIPPNGNPARSLLAYWLTMAGVGAFVCCALLAVQGMTALVLSYRLYLRVSGFLQLAAFLLILGVYSLKPPLANLKGLTAPAHQRLLARLPSFWFLGLFQELNGPTHPVFGPLAGRALWALCLAFALATGTFALSYRRGIRRLVEQPDITPADRVRPLARFMSFIVTRMLPKPLERAILLFTARTLVRSRQHRLLLAAYGGIGLAMALAYARSYVYGDAEQAWNQPNVAFLVGGVVLLFFVVLGARAAFALPASLQSNWVFRITAVHRPAAYFAAVRKSMYTLAAAPVWIICAILYLAIWPTRPALEHLAILLVTGALFVEKALGRYRKIPFACSYLPGKANVHVSLYAYGILFWFLTDSGSRLEYWALERSARFLTLFGVLVAAAIWAYRRRAEFTASPGNRLQFEDLPRAEVFALDLRRDGTWLSDEAYVDAIDP
jgi:hypothetical protein